MNLNIRYKKPFEEVHQGPIELHKNAKGYNICLEGKFFFPLPGNPVIKQIDKYQDKELWVVITKDEISYGHFQFAVPDFFLRILQDKEGKSYVAIEKEIPLNQLDNPEETFKWDYVIIASCKTIEETDNFIEIAENKGVPEPLIKLALQEFYKLK